MAKKAKFQTAEKEIAHPEIDDNSRDLSKEEGKVPVKECESSEYSSSIQFDDGNALLFLPISEKTVLEEESSTNEDRREVNDLVVVSPFENSVHEDMYDREDILEEETIGKQFHVDMKDPEDIPVEITLRKVAQKDMKNSGIQKYINNSENISEKVTFNNIAVDDPDTCEEIAECVANGNVIDEVVNDSENGSQENGYSRECISGFDIPIEDFNESLEGNSSNKEGSHEMINYKNVSEIGQECVVDNVCPESTGIHVKLKQSYSPLKNKKFRSEERNEWIGEVPVKSYTTEKQFCQDISKFQDNSKVSKNVNRYDRTLEGVCHQRPRKRRWGKSNIVRIIDEPTPAISTSLLKKLIPNVESVSIEEAKFPESKDKSESTDSIETPEFVADKWRRATKEHDWLRNENKMQKSSRVVHGNKNAAPNERPKQLENKPMQMLNNLFKKTKTEPRIYWLPLSPEQIAKGMEMRRRRIAEAAKKREENGTKKTPYDSSSAIEERSERYRREKGTLPV